MDYHIPEKANRVLNIIILGLMLILIRVWFLAVIQHDEHVALSRKPQRRSIIEHVERATIRDRFNIPLALNKMQYAAAVCYADIRSIPSVRWTKDADGKPKRVQARANYIHELSQMLAQELKLDAQQIEDTIHGKASLFPHTPFVLKEDISEDLYYRLKLLETDWVGIRTERKSTRYYPRGKVGSDIIGYMGAISSNEYFNIAQEIKILQSYLHERESGEMPFCPRDFTMPSRSGSGCASFKKRPTRSMTLSAKRELNLHSMRS
jgi:cell division protein FtsI/penicillin-binding protein 2